MTNPHQADLVERMLDASDLASPDSDSWRKYCADDKRRMVRAMTAALEVALREALGPVTDVEARGWDDVIPLACCNWFLAARYDRLLSPPAPLSLTDRPKPTPLQEPPAGLCNTIEMTMILDSQREDEREFLDRIIAIADRVMQEFGIIRQDIVDELRQRIEKEVSK